MFSCVITQMAQIVIFLEKKNNTQLSLIVYGILKTET